MSRLCKTGRCAYLLGLLTAKQKIKPPVRGGSLVGDHKNVRLGVICKAYFAQHKSKNDQEEQTGQKTLDRKNRERRFG